MQMRHALPLDGTPPAAAGVVLFTHPAGFSPIAIAVTVYDSEFREERRGAAPLEVSVQAEYIRSKNMAAAVV